MISLLYTAGNVPFGMYSLLVNVVSIDASVFYITIAILYTYKSLSIFIFYFFNKNYREVFHSYLKN